MEYPPPMHHQVPLPCKPPNHHPSHHPLLSNQLQPINSDSHTTMWLDDPYSACPSQRDSGFNSRPASLRSIESSSTASIHHASATYEQIPPHLSNDIENTHPQYVEMQSAPGKPNASQFIPELLGLLMEDDPVILREAVLLTHTLVKEGGESRSEVIRNREVSNLFISSN
jgi:hypothetical protein